MASKTRNAKLIDEIIPFIRLVSSSDIPGSGVPVGDLSEAVIIVFPNGSMRQISKEEKFAITLIDIATREFIQRMRTHFKTCRELEKSIETTKGLSKLSFEIELKKTKEQWEEYLKFSIEKRDDLDWASIENFARTMA